MCCIMFYLSKIFNVWKSCKIKVCYRLLCGPWTSTRCLLEMQNINPDPRSTALESVLKQDHLGIYMHVKV